MERVNSRTRKFIALIMSFVMVMTLFTNLVLHWSKAEEDLAATPTDANVSYSLMFSALQESGELFDYEKCDYANLSNLVYSIYTDYGCTDKVGKFVLSINGKSYVDGNGNDITYDKAEDISSGAIEKKVELYGGTYYIKQDAYLNNSDVPVNDVNVVSDGSVWTVDLHNDEQKAKVTIYTILPKEDTRGDLTSEDVTEGEVTTEVNDTIEPATNSENENKNIEVATSTDGKPKFDVATSKTVKAIANLSSSKNGVTVNKTGTYYGSSGKAISYKFGVDSNLTYGSTGVGFCMEEGVIAPTNKVRGTLQKVPKNGKNITRAFYYSPYGPKPWTGWDGKSEDTKVKTMSCVLDHYYQRNGNGFDSNDFGSTIAGMAISYVSWIESQAMPVTESELKLTCDDSNFKSTVNYTSGSTLRTGVIKWTGCDAKVYSPDSRVSIYVSTKSGAAFKKVNSGATVKKGYQIKFTTPYYRNTVSSIIFESVPGYNAYAVTYDTYQDIGFLGKPKTVQKTIDITWHSATILKLEKSLNTTANNYALADTNNNSLSFENGKRRGVAFKVLNQNNKQVGSFICSWNGKCYANKSGQKLVFASRADYNAYKATHNDLVYQKIVVPVGTYRAIELPNAYYFNGTVPVDSGKSISSIYGIHSGATSSVSTSVPRVDDTSTDFNDSTCPVFTFSLSDNVYYGKLKMRKFALEGSNKTIKAGAVYELRQGNTIVARFESQAGNKNHGWAIVTWMNTPEYPSLYMTNDANEKVSNDGIKLFGIPYGEYKVVETVAPEGCTINDKDAVIKIGKDGDRTKSTITYYEPSKSGNTVSYKSVTKESANSECVQYAAVDLTEGDPVGIVLRKINAENPNASKQSTASLEGAIFEIKYYEGKKPAEVEAGNGGEPKTWHITTKYEDGRYQARFDKKCTVVMAGDSPLPALDVDEVYKLAAGTITLTEVKASDGYMKVSESDAGFIKITNADGGKRIDGNDSVTIEVGPGGNIYFQNEMTKGALEIYEPVQRGDVRFKKVRATDDGMEPMGNVVFKITDKNTGEFHYVVTDENGEFSSKKVRETYGTADLNKNCIAYSEGNGSYTQGDISPNFGVWFTGSSVDDCAKMDRGDIKADRGSFPYGTYIIEEMRCDANKGYVLSEPQEFTVKSNNDEVSLAENFVNVPYPSLTTNATHTISRGESVDVSDKVELKWIKGDYTLKGIVMDKKTGKAATDTKGNYITAVLPFSTEGNDYVRNDSKEMIFKDFDSTKMDSTYVVFEYLYEGTDTDELEVVNGMPDITGVMKDDAGNPICHADIENTDGSQTFNVVSIKTKAFVDGDTGNNRIQATKRTKISDTISYEGLTKGDKYTVRSKMAIVSPSEATATDAPKYAEGELLSDADGAVIEKEETFTADKTDGTFTMKFDAFDATKYDGCTIVVYEYLYDSEGNLIAKEEDVTCKDQMIYFIHIHTTSNNNLDPAERMKAYDKEITLIDKVTATNLNVGKPYRIDGVLMNIDKGEPVKRSDGTIVTGSTSFTATGADMVIDVAFTYNPVDCGLIGATTVVFEGLFYKDEKVAAHEELTDTPQQNTYPFVKTLLSADGDKEILGETAKLSDVISYDAVVAGQKYTVVDKLMNARTGKAVKVNGKEITARTEFTASVSTGSVTAEFPEFNIFDAGLVNNGKADDVVAYSYLYLGTGEDLVLIAREEDIKSTTQTVRIKDKQPKISTTFHVTGSDDKAFTTDMKEISLTDTVSYTGLDEGIKYRMESVIMVKDTGKELMVNGSVYKVSKTFTAKKNGTVDMTFKFDPSIIMRNDGTCSDLVAYEYLYRVSTGEEEARHTDISDGGQTVYPAPTGKTKARDKASGTQMAYPGTTTTIVDHIYYKDLVVGKTYTVKGSIRFKDTGEKLNAEGTEREETFTATKSTGIYDMVFTFDASLLKGKQIVFFERVETKDREVFVHEDLKDKDQTITFPEIGTTASADGSKELKKGAKNTVSDVITYKNLEAGATYRIEGSLVNKATGETVATASKSLVPKGKGNVDGVTTMDFEIDVPKEGSGTKTYVVFEHIFAENGAVLADHADINSDAQTVYVKYENSPNTGDNKPIRFVFIILGVAIVGAFGLLGAKILRKKEDDE